LAHIVVPGFVQSPIIGMIERCLVPELGGEIGRGIFSQMVEHTCLVSPEGILEPAANAGDRYRAITAKKQLSPREARHRKLA
jgi:hypothetical protein